MSADIREIKGMDKEHLCMQMGENILDYGKMVYNMDKENFMIKLEMLQKEYGNLVN